MNPLHLAVLTQNEHIIEQLMQSRVKEKLKVQRDSRTRRPAQLLDIDATKQCQQLLTTQKISRAQLATMTSRVADLDAIRRAVRHELIPLQKALQRTTTQFLPKYGIDKHHETSHFTVKSISYER